MTLSLGGLVRAALFALGLAAAPLHAQSVAFSFDDGPTLDATPRLTPQARNEAMLAALAKHKLKAALFVTAGNGANRPEGLALAQTWSRAGYLIGNHTMTHPSLNDAKVGLAQYQQELLDCDRIIAALPGQSLLLSMARSLGLGTADIGLRLMDDGDFEIELLKQKGL